MINTIINGFFSVSMNIMNWFLTPIWNIIDNIDLGGSSVSDLITQVNNLFNLLSNTMSWIIDATGIPRVIFSLMFGVYLTCISMRIAIYIVKMILRWWDKIFA